MARVVNHPGLQDKTGRKIAGRLIEVAGVDTYAYDHGSGPPIFFLHGYGDTADGWRTVIPNLKQEHRAIAIDVPPFGRSEDPNRLRPVADLVEFYREFFPALFEALGIASATFVGHSLGGAIALEAALERPEMVERLVVVAPAGLDSGAPLWWRLVAAMAGPGGLLLRGANPLTPRLLRATVKAFIERMVVRNPQALDGELNYLVDLYANGRELNKVLSAGRALIGSYTGDLAQRASQLACPTLAIWGRHDALVPIEHAGVMAAASELVQTKILDNCGHYPQIELPREFNRALNDFLRDKPASSNKMPRSATSV